MEGRLGAYGKSSNQAKVTGTNFKAKAGIFFI